MIGPGLSFGGYRLCQGCSNGQHMEHDDPDTHCDCDLEESE